MSNNNITSLDNITSLGIAVKDHPFAAQLKKVKGKKFYLHVKTAGGSAVVVPDATLFSSDTVLVLTEIVDPGQNVSQEVKLIGSLSFKKNTDHGHASLRLVNGRSRRKHRCHEALLMMSQRLPLMLKMVDTAEFHVAFTHVRYKRSKNVFAPATSFNSYPDKFPSFNLPFPPVLDDELESNLSDEDLPDLPGNNLPDNSNANNLYDNLFDKNLPPGNNLPDNSDAYYAQVNFHKMLEVHYNPGRTDMLPLKRTYEYTGQQLEEVMCGLFRDISVLGQSFESISNDSRELGQCAKSMTAMVTKISSIYTAREFKYIADKMKLDTLAKERDVVMRAQEQEIGELKSTLREREVTTLVREHEIAKQRQEIADMKRKLNEVKKESHDVHASNSILINLVESKQEGVKQEGVSEFATPNTSGGSSTLNTSGGSSSLKRRSTGS